MTVEVKHVSASSIASFKRCPIAYKIAYVDMLRQAEEAAPLRIGTNWHMGVEILEAGGTVEEAIAAATEGYNTIPDGVDPTDWAVEREVIANAIAAYAWRYGEAQDFETVANELEFELPLVNPETGHSTPNFVRVGRIDRIVRSRLTGALLVREDKSTSRPIDSGSTYWNRLRKDTQSKFYILAARYLQNSRNLRFGKNEEDWNAYPTISGLLHCVFRKPSISPKKLTQAESAKFVETGEYCGQKFVVKCIFDWRDMCIDEVRAEVEIGKKPGTFALRETPAMYGARLFEDMTTTDDDHHGPDWYFARKEVAFTDAEMTDFAYQVWNIQKTMAEMTRTGRFYENESQCEPTGGFKCPYCPICFNNVDLSTGLVPPGFKRLERKVAEETTTEVGE
jgi:hypothetical protein